MTRKDKNIIIHTYFTTQPIQKNKFNNIFYSEVYYLNLGRYILFILLHKTNLKFKTNLCIRNHEPLQPSERHNFNKATSDMPPPPAPSGPGGDRSRRMKPLTPTKPSTLSFRQSSALNGSPNYGIFGATQFQMPKER